MLPPRPPRSTLSLPTGRAVALALGVLSASLSMPAAADICKYIDAEGRIIYSNIEVPDARRIGCPIVSSDPPAKPAADGGSPGSSPTTRTRTQTPTPVGFPRVDSSAQKGRDDLRRRVLKEELTGEEKALAEARASYGNGAPAALPEEKGNAQKYAERLSRLRQTVQLHERNVEALRKEIANLR